LTFELAWARIEALEGAPFRQKMGKEFHYAIVHGCVVPDTTNHQLARSQFEKAWERRPIAGPGQLSDLRGPSFLFAILTDPRIVADA